MGDPTSPTETNPTVTASSGTLRGAGIAGGAIWRAIPYAVADRFEPPRPAPSWTDDRDATAPGPQAPQLPSILDQMLGPASLAQDEDCLSLDVWAPAVEPGGPGRPVLVWIHGGAFTNGTGAAPWYDGAAFVRAGCVLVTLNYRLGALGFLAAPGLADGSGNLGLLDQIAALRWVRDEIGAFGGDPDNVTVFGESAGGLSVLSLLTAPAAEGLFHRAWAMSPSMTQLRSAARARTVAAEVIAAAGLPDDDIEALRTLPVERLLAAQGGVLRGRELFTAFGPTPDGVVVPHAGVTGASTDSWGAGIPLVLGSTRDEMALFTAFDPAVQGLDDAGLERRAQPVFGERTPAALATYRTAMPGAPPGRLATAIATDYSFRMPATHLAEARSAVGSATWLYWFTWPTPVFGGVLGSCHGVDIPFAFHALDGPGVELFTGTGDDRLAVADAFHGAIAEFAVNGTVRWPRYEGRSRPVWKVDASTEVVHDPEPALHALYPVAAHVAALRIVQISDTHLSHRRAYGVGNVVSVLRWIATDPPHAVVHTGDVVADDPDDAEERAFAQGVLATVPAPLFTIPGNHDTGGFTGDRPTAARLAAWHAAWGPDTFCVDIGLWRLVGANVYRLAEPDHDAWLASSMATQRPIALFLHQPICLVHPDQTDDGDWSVARPLRRPLREAMAGRPVRLVASGHLHRYRAGALPGGIPTVWCPPASFLGTERDDDSAYVVGAVEHTLHDDGTATHRLVRPPAVTDLGMADFAPDEARGVRDAPLLPVATRGR